MRPTTATTEDTEVIALADVSITKDDGDGSADDLVVVAGQDSITYSLSIANSGPSDAQGVVVTDTLPAGVTFVGASARSVRRRVDLHPRHPRRRRDDLLQRRRQRRCRRPRRDDPDQQRVDLRARRPTRPADNSDDRGHRGHRPRRRAIPRTTATATPTTSSWSPARLDHLQPLDRQQRPVRRPGRGRHRHPPGRRHLRRRLGRLQ